MQKFKPKCWHLPRPSSVYRGSYPLYFEDKFKKLVGFSDYLHLFSGSAKTGFKVDIKRENKPHLVADCHHLPFRDNSFNGVLADPPYNDDYAKRLYKTPNLKPTKYMKEMVRVCKPNGIIALYHLIQYRNPKGCRYLGVLTIVTRMFHHARIVTFYKKDAFQTQKETLFDFG